MISSSLQSAANAALIAIALERVSKENRIGKDLKPALLGFFSGWVEARSNRRITGFSARDKRTSVRIRLEQHLPSSGPEYRLHARFEDLCDAFAELDACYGLMAMIGPEENLERLRERVLPAVESRIRAIIG